MAQTEAVTVRRQVVVDTPIERAFAVFTGRSRVELEHRHIDRHGPGWEAVTGAVDGPEGWPLYLGRYAALVRQGR